MDEAKVDYELIDGVKCYAPEMALENQDFSGESFQFLYEAEEKNFWFVSRNTIIQHLVKKYVGVNQPKSILEIGCGTGYVLKGIRKQFPNLSLTGAEIYLKGIEFARKRLPDVEFIQLNATAIPFRETFDAIGAFDVLEHIEADVAVMRNVHQALKPGGHFLITVPQYMSMWSVLDDMACHKRRYSREEMFRKLKESRFDVVYVGSFVFTLFPLMALSRLLKKDKKAEAPTQANLAELSELQLPNWMNTLFSGAMKLDEFLIGRGVSLPFGGSLVVVAKKSS
jgi:SAM-dependent methyltransferase